MNTCQQLPIFPCPQSMEFFESYIQRLAYRNGWNSISAFCRILGIDLKSGSAFILKEYDQAQSALESVLPDKVSQELACCATVPSWYFEAERPIASIANKDPKYCWWCLAENKPCHWHWRLLPVTHCHLHRTELVDCCPSCQKVIGLDPQIWSGACPHCHAAWPTQTPLASLPPWQIFFYRLMDQQAAIETGLRGFCAAIQLAARPHDSMHPPVRVCPESSGALLSLIEAAWSLIVCPDIRTQWIAEQTKAGIKFPVLSKLIEHIETIHTLAETEGCPRNIVWQERDAQSGWIDKTRLKHSRDPEILRNQAEYDAVIAAAGLPFDQGLILHTSGLVRPYPQQGKNRLYPCSTAHQLIDLVPVATKPRSCYCVVHTHNNKKLLRLFLTDPHRLILALANHDVTGYRSAKDASLRSVWFDKESLYRWLHDELKRRCRQKSLTLRDACSATHLDTNRVRELGKQGTFQFTKGTSLNSLWFTGSSVETALNLYRFPDRDAFLRKHFPPIYLETDLYTGSAKTPLLANR